MIKSKKCIHLVTEDGLYDWKIFYTVKIVFYLSSIWVFCFQYLLHRTFFQFLFFSIGRFPFSFATVYFARILVQLISVCFQGSHWYFLFRIFIWWPLVFFDNQSRQIGLHRLINYHPNLILMVLFSHMNLAKTKAF